MDEKNTLTMQQESKENLARERIQGRVLEETPGIGHMVLETIFGGTIEAAKEYVYKNVFKPDIKAMAFNALMSFMSVWIFGDDRSRKANSSSQFFRSSLDQNKKAEFQRAASGGTAVNNSTRPQGRAGNDLKEIVFETRQQAEHVAQILVETCKAFDSVSVYKYYEEANVNVSDINYTQKSTGWINLNHLDVYQTPEGWMIELPRPVNINRALASKGGRR